MAFGTEETPLGRVGIVTFDDGPDAMKQVYTPLLINTKTNEEHNALVNVYIRRRYNFKHKCTYEHQIIIKWW